MHILTKVFIVLVSMLAVLLVPLVVVYAHNEDSYKAKYEEAETLANANQGHSHSHDRADQLHDPTGRQLQYGPSARGNPESNASPVSHTLADSPPHTAGPLCGRRRWRGGLRLDQRPNGRHDTCRVRQLHVAY